MKKVLEGINLEFFKNRKEGIVVKNWKKQLLERLPQVFSDKSGSLKDHDREKEKLYQQIGQLQVELTWLKKKVNIYNS